MSINRYKDHSKYLFDYLSFKFLEICRINNQISYNLKDDDYIFNYYLFKLVKSCLIDYNIVRHKLDINYLDSYDNFNKVFEYMCNNTSFKQYLKE